MGIQWVGLYCMGEEGEYRMQTYMYLSYSNRVWDDWVWGMMGVRHDNVCVMFGGVDDGCVLVWDDNFSHTSDIPPCREQL